MASKRKRKQALNPKQQRFVDEYVIDCNATQAAIRAGYSHNSAGSIGEENLKKPEIKKAIAEARAAQRQRTHITADRVLEEYAALAFSNIDQIFDFSGDTLRLRPASEIPLTARRALAAVKVRRHVEDGQEVEILDFRLGDKLAALDKLAAHLGIGENDPGADCPPVVIRILPHPIIVEK
ncbi:MAG TPA: terminase small subunit [Gemmataceae bacterium]|jgi:phage terminase small subunit|nr:terminase small subunit [Gemmataceae bacterium]